ncbi:MAG: hypothetical protein AAFX81_12275 [Pseudomonadota bacterium]
MPGEHGDAWSEAAPLWRERLSVRALRNVTASGAAATAAWHHSLAGDRCGTETLAAMLRDGVGSEPGPRSAPTLAAAHDGAGSARSERRASRHGRGEARSVLTAPAEQNPADAAVEPAKAIAATASWPAAPTSRQLESDDLFASLLGGGPAASLLPPVATPEPDERAEGSSLRGAGEAPSRATYGDVRMTAPPPPEPELDFADALARALADEARRHGIDVGMED